jgi:hypothetical protein
MNPFLLLPGTDDTIPFGMPGYMQVMSLIPGGAACGNSSEASPQTDEMYLVRKVVGV